MLCWRCNQRGQCLPHVHRGWADGQFDVSGEGYMREEFRREGFDDGGFAFHHFAFVAAFVSVGLLLFRDCFCPTALHTAWFVGCT